MESIEYLVETPGEAIPHLNMRVFYKHRGVENRFAGMTAADGVLLAERAEGIASVAHALAFCHAVERIAGCQPPRPRAWSGCCTPSSSGSPTTSTSRSGWPTRPGSRWPPPGSPCTRKRVLRLVSRLCGSRFGRGVVVPGGVSAPLRLPPAEIRTEVDKLRRAVTAEAAALMATSSFLDRLRGTGPLMPQRARQHGALGPIGKAAGYADDARLARPYDAYPSLAVPPVRSHAAGDALARLWVRWEEVDQSFGLLRQVADDLAERSSDPLRLPCEPRGDDACSGRAVGWAEAPQGEVIYDVRMDDGRIVRCHPRSASFHNLVLMHEVFTGDILTDFPFIEASFGLSIAGVLAVSIWVLRGLRDGVVTTRWPARPDPYADGWHGPARPLTVPLRLAAPRLTSWTRSARPGRSAVAGTSVRVDQGRCILCGRCVAERPDLFAWSQGATGPGAAALSREALIVPELPETDEAVEAARARLRQRTAALRRSVHVRHVDAGSDGSEEWEIQALLGPVYDIHRLGVFLTASPRHADVLLVTGAGARGMSGPLRTTYDGMPDPKVVIAVGTDAVSGGLLSQSEAVTGGIAATVPVDVWLPGSPPSPFGILNALLIAVGKLASGEEGDAVSGLFAAGLILLALAAVADFAGGRFTG